MITVPAGYKLVPLELTDIQAKAAWPYHYWIESFIHWREKDYASTVKAFPELVGFRYRHSEQENWHYGVEPQSWWECSPVFATDEDAHCVLPAIVAEGSFNALEVVKLKEKIESQEAIMNSVASWIKQLPFPTNGASAQLYYIDQLLGTDHTHERSVAKFQEPQE